MALRSLLRFPTLLTAQSAAPLVGCSRTLSSKPTDKPLSDADIEALTSELKNKLPATYYPGKAGYYGKFFFTVAQHFGVTHKVESQLQKFSQVMNAFPRIRHALRDTQKSNPARLLGALEALDVTEEAAAMIQLLAKDDALDEFDKIVYAYSSILVEETRQLRGTLTLGYKDPAWTDFWKDRLHKLFPGSSIEIEINVDPSLGPGAKYNVGAYTVDESIERKLERIHQAAEEARIEEYKEKLQSLQRLDIFSPPTEDQIKLRELFNPGNYNYDFQKLHDAYDAKSGSIDWSRVPQPSHKFIP